MTVEDRCDSIKLIIEFILMSLVVMEVIVKTNVYISASDSVPPGIYVRVPKMELQRGDYIVYEPSEEIKKIIRANGWGDGNQKFLKKVGGVEGDKYEVESKHQIFLINGKYSGEVFLKDREGKELPQLQGKYKIGEGEILPIGTNLRSFDGRYTGAIKASEIEAKVVPLFTWGE